MPAGGEAYDSEPIRPHKFVILPAAYIGETGVEPVVIVEMYVTEHQLSYMLPVEMALSTAIELSGSLARVSGVEVS